MRLVFWKTPRNFLIKIIYFISKTIKHFSSFSEVHDFTRRQKIKIIKKRSTCFYVNESKPIIVGRTRGSTSASMEHKLKHGKHVFNQNLDIIYLGKRGKFEPITVFSTMTHKNLGTCNSVTLQLLDKMSQRNLVSWNTMIAGYVHNNMVEEANQLFYIMPQRQIFMGFDDNLLYSIHIGGSLRRPENYLIWFLIGWTLKIFRLHWIL